MLPDHRMRYEEEEEDYDILIKPQPSLCHYLNQKEKKLIGTTDGLEAVKQAVYFMLNTERYEHEIYPANYGIQCRDLIGTSKSHVISEIKGRIIEALQQDDRIESAGNFKLEEAKKGTLAIAFTVTSTEGVFDTKMEVLY